MKELTNFYDSVHMPKECEDRILNTISAPRRKFRPAAAVAAVLALVLVLGMSPTVRAAVEDWITTRFPGLDLTIQQRTTEEGIEEMIVSIDTEVPTFAYAENGRLYFTGNGENLDITDEITEEKPYFYTCEDDRGYEIYFVVGYDGTIENFGTYEFIRKDGQWFTGSGRNFLSSQVEGQAYPWVKVVWDTLSIPWPMPGDIIVNSQ